MKKKKSQQIIQSHNIFTNKLKLLNLWIKTDGCSVIEQRLETALFIFIFCQIVVCYEAIGKKSCPFIFFLRVWLVGRRIKRRTTAQPAVEMHKPIRRGFALGESSGQWEKGAARIWNGANYLGICSARTLLVASPPCDMIVYFPA